MCIFVKPQQIFCKLSSESMEEMTTKTGSDLFICYMGGKLYLRREDSSEKFRCKGFEAEP